MKIAEKAMYGGKRGCEMRWLVEIGRWWYRSSSSCGGGGDDSWQGGNEQEGSSSSCVRSSSRWWREIPKLYTTTQSRTTASLPRRIAELLKLNAPIAGRSLLFPLLVPSRLHSRVFPVAKRRPLSTKTMLLPHPMSNWMGKLSAFHGVANRSLQAFSLSPTPVTNQSSIYHLTVSPLSAPKQPNFHFDISHHPPSQGTKQH